MAGRRAIGTHSIRVRYGNRRHTVRYTLDDKGRAITVHAGPQSGLPGSVIPLRTADRNILLEGVEDRIRARLEAKHPDHRITFNLTGI